MGRAGSWDKGSSAIERKLNRELQLTVSTSPVSVCWILWTPNLMMLLLSIICSLSFSFSFIFSFWDCILIAIFLPSRLPPNPPTHRFLSPSNSWPFYFINCYCIHVCFMCTYILLNITHRVHITLLRYMIFTADHLVPNNHWERSSLGMASSPNFTQLPVVLCVGLLFSLEASLEGTPCSAKNSVCGKPHLTVSPQSFPAVCL